MVSQTMNISPKNINRPRNIAIIALIILALSFLFGAGIGRFLLGRLVTGQDALAFVMSRPTREFVVISRLVNSRSELDRLSGYYALLDNGMLDTGFFAERLQKEISPVVRRTIVWILGFSGNREEALSVLSAAFDSAGPRIKREVLLSMQRIDEKYYNDFVQKKRAGGK